MARLAGRLQLRELEELHVAPHHVAYKHCGEILRHSQHGNFLCSGCGRAIHVSELPGFTAKAHAAHNDDFHP